MSWAALSPVHARENSATGSGFCTLICLCGGPKAAFCVNESVWPCRLAGFLCASACCLCARFSFYSSFWVWPESRWCKQYKHATHPRLAPRVGGCTAAQQLLPCSRCVDETPCVGDSWLFASSASLPRSRIPTTCHRGVELRNRCNREEACWNVQSLWTLCYWHSHWCHGVNGLMEMSHWPTFVCFRSLSAFPRSPALLLVHGFICPSAALWRPYPAEASNWQTTVCLRSLTGPPF